jgi:hypothetical protein
MIRRSHKRPHLDLQGALFISRRMNTVLAPLADSIVFFCLEYLRAELMRVMIARLNVRAATVKVYNSIKRTSVVRHQSLSSL